MENTVKKPKCKFTGKDGNIFNLMGIASRAMRKDNQNPKPMLDRVMKAGSYEEAIGIIAEYCEIS